MAELTDPTDAAPQRAARPSAGDCCEPAEKADCCAPEATACGCAAGAAPTPRRDIREAVRAKYAAAAARPPSATPTTTRTTDANGVEVWGAALYGDDAAEAPAAAIAASLGCGVPTAVADLHAGRDRPRPRLRRRRRRPHLRPPRRRRPAGRSAST